MAVLYVVATPLGNLEDITGRARRILAEVEVVAAESIDRTRALLAALGIKAGRLVSCREVNRERAAQEITRLLAAGQNVALVSDAGSPGLSDPAAAVVRRAVAGGFTVSPVAGPSAVAAAWSVAGIDHAPFIVLGFLPVKSGEKTASLQQAKHSGWPFVFFEAPHRMQDSARILAQLMPERSVVLCREMTKMHEQIAHLKCPDLPEWLAEREIRGEFTLVVGAPAADEFPQRDDKLADLEQLLAISRGMSASQLAAFLAKARKLPREMIYKQITALKNKK